MRKTKKIEIIKEEIEEEIEHEITEEKSLAKRIIVIIGAIFLALLVVSFVLVNYPIGDILAGRSESVLIRGDVIFLDKFKISLENGTDEQLEELYFKDRKKEISICMKGYEYKDTYFIMSFYQPKTYDESVAHVSFEPCSADTIVMLHTHPFKHCIASETDINTLNKTKENSPDVIMIIMCESDRFSVYG